MEEMYAPPFRMTEETTNLVIEIGECVGKISVSDAATKDPKLRRVNRMQTIHATLAIQQKRAYSRTGDRRDSRQTGARAAAGHLRSEKCL